MSGESCSEKTQRRRSQTHRMKTFQTLILVAVVGLTLAHDREIPHFLEMISCMMPEGRIVMDYNNYGCYCGYGGRGTPVDDLDRCCQEHDNCYSQVRASSACDPIFNDPYSDYYHFCCRRSRISCTCHNNDCQADLCECDKKAAECFARTPYKEEYRGMSRANC